MSKRNRHKSSTTFLNYLTELPSKKKRKIDSTTEVQQALSIMWSNYVSYYWGAKNNNTYDVNDFEQCFTLLLTLPLEQRKQLVTTNCKCLRGNCGWWCARCHGCNLLLQMIDNTSYKFASEFFARHNKSIALPQINKTKLNVIRNLTYPLISVHGESHRMPILTIELDKTRKNNAWSWHFKPYEIGYYNGAIESLEDFTAELFLDSVKDFNFFRFYKNTINDKGKSVYVDCNDDEVLNLLESLKMNRKSQ
eukprot:332021_1